MTTYASPTELAIIFGVLGVPLGILPAATSAFAFWRPTPARRWSALVVTTLAAAGALWFGRGWGLLGIVGLVLGAAAIAWALAIGTRARAWSVVAVAIAVLPLLIVVALAATTFL